MADSTSQLKRKRESAVGAQSKKKKQRKSDTGIGKDAEAIVANGAPTTESATDGEPSVRKSQEQSESSTQISQVNGVHSDARADKSSKTDQNEKEVVKAQAAGSRKADSKKNRDSSWSLSPAQGGWFLPVDPVFSSDEKYILLAIPTSLQIYSTETSLLTSTLPIGGTGVTITAYALSSADPNQVYIADSNKLITLWDWVDGKKIGRWDIGAIVRNMAVITQPGSNDDLVFCHEAGSKHVINVHALRTKGQASESELKHVLKTTANIQGIQVLLQGKYAIIATATSIIVGKRIKPSKTAIQDFEYVWREFEFSKHITTFNAFFRTQEVAAKAKKPVQDQRDNLDLVVGDETGVILLFEDILASFAALDRTQKPNKNDTYNAESMRPKRLHWHREAVGSVKWSRDGNYIISGGDETVITIWQLATGKPQHLPHLTAAIENVVVSPMGASYALTLANNSVIVLSTTELAATTNIIGLQSRHLSLEQVRPSEWPAGKPLSSLFQPVPMSVNPKNNQLLLSVPSSQPRSKFDVFRPEPYLQTFDLANNRPIARQAVTRNNATDPLVTPEGARIIEPSVKFIQVSHDGEWLATVDEWLPSPTDTNYLNEGIPELNEEERLLRREVYLKIWRWDEKKAHWALEARIDAPHVIEDVAGSGQVFDLVADPTEHGFATIGEDNIARIWRPKTRMRDGLVVRGAGNQGLVNWSLDRSIQLPSPWTLDGTSNWSQTRSISRLAWSADSSVLVAAVPAITESDSGLIHFIDVSSATIQRSMTEIDVTLLCGLSIIGRHLVIVTDCITVWDLVCDRPVYFASVPTPNPRGAEWSSAVRLATNEENGTFAVSLPSNQGKVQRIKKTWTKIAVYSTSQREPLWTTTVRGAIFGLVSMGENGYIALDDASCIRTISPSITAIPTPPPEEPIERQNPNEVTEAIEDVEDEVPRKAIAVEDTGYDKPVVTQQDLEEIFHTGNALPSPKELFSAVLRLFGGVTKQAV